MSLNLEPDDEVTLITIPSCSYIIVGEVVINKEKKAIRDIEKFVRS